MLLLYILLIHYLTITITEFWGAFRQYSLLWKSLWLTILTNHHNHDWRKFHISIRGALPTLVHENPEITDPRLRTCAIGDANATWQSLRPRMTLRTTCLELPPVHPCNATLRRENYQIVWTNSCISLLLVVLLFCSLDLLGARHPAPK